MGRVQLADEESSATALELFFDLVFVFALTQVTALMAHFLGTVGIAQGLLVTAILWWCWVCFSWLGNVVRADVGAARVGLLTASAGIFVMALSIPEAFHDMPGGLHGPTTFAAGYLWVRVVHVILYTLVSRDDAELRHQVVLFGGTMVGSATLLLLAGNFDGVVQLGLWFGVLVVDYGGTLLIGNSGWRLRSPRHFAERHGLIVIVALGESIAALGVGVSDTPISWPVILASVLGLSITASLWWAYFDVVSTRAEHAFARARGHHRVAVGQVAYSYLHLPMLAGIVLVALGLKHELQQAGNLEQYTFWTALPPVAGIAFFGGAAMFLLASVWFSAQTGNPLQTARVVVAVLLVAAAPATAVISAVASLAALTVVLVLLDTWETMRDRRSDLDPDLAGDRDRAAAPSG